MKQNMTREFYRLKWTQSVEHIVFAKVHHASICMIDWYELNQMSFTRTLTPYEAYEAIRRRLYT